MKPRLVRYRAWIRRRRALMYRGFLWRGRFLRVVETVLIQ